MAIWDPGHPPRHLGVKNWLGKVVIFKAFFGCHDIRNFGWAASPIKMRQRPDMTIAVDRDLTKHDIDTVRYLYWSCFP